MKLQRWKIKLNEFDYKIKYLPGKENHIADALSRVKLNENFLGETNSNTAATIHSAHENNENYISITERPLNYYNRQLEFNKGLEAVNSIVSEKEKSIKLELLIFNLEHFTEYIEDIEMGMQLTRLGIFNPKLLKHNYLKHVDSEKLLNTKTSTWLKTDTNEILIISHIPREIIKTPIFEILPYPDPEKNILTENSHDKYYFENENVYNKNTKQLETNECIIGILKQVTTSCKYTKTFKNYQITYIEPNIIVTWNLPKTKLNQDCVNNELTIEGNNIIKNYDCSLQLNEISIKNSYFDNSQSIYVTNNITKLEPISYLQTKEIINQHTKYNSVFQTITIITFVIIILSITLYLIYKLKIVPQKLIINVNNTKKTRFRNPKSSDRAKPFTIPKNIRLRTGYFLKDGGVIYRPPHIT